MEPTAAAGTRRKQYETPQPVPIGCVGVLYCGARARGQDPVHRAFSERFVPERDVRDRIGRLKEGRYAVLTKCLYGKHFTESDRVPAALLGELRTGRACLSQFYVGFGFVRRSPYVRPADLVVRRVFESGLVDYWLGRVAGARASSSSSTSSSATFRHVYEIRPPRHDAAPRALSYTQFKVVVVAWTVGCALSAVVFAAELRRAPSRHPPEGARPVFGSPA